MPHDKPVMSRSLHGSLGNGLTCLIMAACFCGLTFAEENRAADKYAELDGVQRDGQRMGIETQLLQKQMVVGPVAAKGMTLNDCMQITLSNNANVLLSQQQMVAAEGIAIQSTAPFDLTISLTANRTKAKRPMRSDELKFFPLSNPDISYTGQYRLGLDQTFKNGIGINVGASLNSRSDQIEQLSGILPSTSGALSFTLMLPLLKNIGEISAAGLAAARLEHQAARFELERSVSSALLDVALAYWDYLAKHRRLEIAINSEVRSKALINEIRRLISADQLPKADIYVVEANHSERRVLRAAAEAAVSESRRRLARAMGIDLKRMLSLTAPTDQFPTLPNQDKPLAFEELVTAALKRRPDLHALELRKQAATQRVAAARGSLKPRVDLTLEASSTGLNEKMGMLSLRPYYENHANTIAASVVFALPFQNSAASGLLLSASSSQDSALIAQREQEATIATNLQVLVTGFSRSIEELRAAKEAVDHYRSALDAEQIRRRIGMSTLIDVLTLEDKLNNARLSEVDLAQSFASTLAQLHFELADFLEFDGTEYRFLLNHFFTPG